MQLFIAFGNKLCVQHKNIIQDVFSDPAQSNITQFQENLFYMQLKRDQTQSMTTLRQWQKPERQN